MYAIAAAAVAHRVNEEAAKRLAHPLLCPAGAESSADDIVRSAMEAEFHATGVDAYLEYYGF